MLAATIMVAGSWLLPAFALGHAELRATEPAAEATVDPGRIDVSLTFNEPVTVLDGAISIHAPDGRRLDPIDLRVERETVSFQADVDADGSWAVSWRVISADTHPVGSVLVFHATAPTGTEEVRAAALASAEVAPGMRVAAVSLRGVGTVAILLAAGMVAMGLAGLGVPGRGVAAAAGIGAGAILLGYAAEVAVAGAYDPGQLTPARLSAQLDGPLGVVAAARLLALVLVLAAWSIGRRMRRVGILLAGASPALLTVGSHAAAAAEAAIRVPADAMHGIAAGLWVGGLVALLAAIRQRPAVAIGAVPRFSGVAFVAVCVLVATGSVQVLLEAGSVEALTGTTWGRAVLAKLVLLGAILPLAARNRRLVRDGIDGGDGLQRLRRYVRIELGILAAVLAVTAVLVTSMPAAQALDPGLQEATEVMPDGTSVQLVLDPARSGPNEVHLYVLDRAGVPDASVAAARLSASEPDLGLRNLELPLDRAGPGHWTTVAASIPQAGTWRFRIDIRRGEFDNRAVVIELPVSTPR